MSGRRSRALKATLARAERRRSIQRTATAPAVLARMVAELDRLDRRSVQRAASRFKGAKSRRAGQRGAYTYRPPAVFLGTVADLFGCT